jgi:hypothetical protein
MTGNPKNHLVHFLAPARIARYRSFLKLATNEEVHRAYAWNYAISAMVFPLLGCVEMHLRDAVHRVMSQRYAPAGAATGHHGYPWYDDAQAQHYPFAKEAKASIDGILCDKKTKARRNPQPTTDDVVAALTFGFWTNFFRTLSPVDASQVISQIFPHHTIQNPKQWGNPQNRHQLGLHLQIANTFRNRVAHHEPLFKFRYQGAYPKKLAIGLNNLRGCMDHCLAISGWIDRGAEQALRQSDWFQHFQVLSTEACFNDWIRNGQPPVHGYYV